MNQYIKRRKKKQNTTITFSTPLGPKDAAERMRNHLATVFGGHQPDSTSPYKVTTPYTTPPPEFCEVGFIHHNIQSELPSRKAPGQDHITTEMLRPIAYPLATILAPLLQLCWSWSYIPSMWRTAQVVPIHKKNDPSVAGNYRPISLTSIFRKLLERTLLPELKYKMAALDLVQGGFRTWRGSMDQAFNLNMMIREYRRRYDHQPTLAFLDIQQAYDSVHRNIIWQRLEARGLDPAFISMLQHMFEEVSISVIIQNHTSSTIHPTTGVLQGSILSPLLYAIFIDSLPSVLRLGCQRPITVRTLPRGTHSEMSILNQRRQSTKHRRIDTHIEIINSTLFADDVALIGSPSDVHHMLSLAEEHSIANGYKWSPTKCQIITTPPPPGSPPPYTYSLYNTPLPITDTATYLGLPFNQYGIAKSKMIHQATTKAIRQQQLLRHLGLHQYSMGIHHALKAYRIFVRPIMEYGLAIINVNPIHQRILQQCQQQCIRLLLNHHADANTPTTIIEHIANLPTIKTRISILQFRFLRRSSKLPPAILIANIIKSFLPFQYCDDEWKRMTKPNTMWQQYQKQKIEKTKKKKKEKDKKKKKKYNPNFPP
jgi:hypothetical protein